MTQTLQQKDKEVEERFEQRLMKQSVPERLYKTGLTTGTVEHVATPNEHVVEFEVRLDSGEHLTIPVTDTGSLGASNELMTVLDTHNVQKPSQLLYRKVTVEMTDFVDYTDLTNNEFQLYTGHEKREILHNLGIPTYGRNVSFTLHALIASLVVFISSTLLPLLIAIGFGVVYYLNGFRLMRWAEHKLQERLSD